MCGDESEELSEYFLVLDRLEPFSSGDVNVSRKGVQRVVVEGLECEFSVSASRFDRRKLDRDSRASLQSDCRDPPNYHHNQTCLSTARRMLSRISA